MNQPLRTKDILLKIINNSLIDLPAPINISIFWNFGSLLGLSLIIQILTGLFLAIHYSSDTEIAFNRINHIIMNIQYGWFIRTLHANGASFFFICLYIHVGRGIYYSSYFIKITWLMGVTIFLATIGAAFLGYVLPWGQISFWGATVITNLISAIPYMGNDLVQWIWGGFSVRKATLTRFFTFHFILPFIILIFIVIHLLFLHQTGSNNPLGINSNINKIHFHPYFIFKDLITIILILIILTSLTLINPYLLGDTDNFIPANPLITPTHIQPEWYFLFAYAILRSIPNKLGGVIALAFSIIILYFLPLINSIIIGCQFRPLIKTLFWVLVNSVLLLTWIGICPVEAPYIITGQILTLIYFSFYLIVPTYQNIKL